MGQIFFFLSSKLDSTRNAQRLKVSTSFVYPLLHSCCIASVPDGAGGGGQRRAKRPDVLFVLLHGGNADLEGGDVGQQRPRGKRGLLPLSVLLRLQQRHELDLDDGAGKTKHTPRRAESSGEEVEDERKNKHS